jgi:hypothetical protein
VLAVARDHPVRFGGTSHRVDELLTAVLARAWQCVSTGKGAKGHRLYDCNQRILQAERVGQGRVLASPAFERIAHPTVDAAGGGPRPCGSAILGSWP